MNDRPAEQSSITWDDIQGLMDALKAKARELLAREGNAGTVQSTQLVNSALKKMVPKTGDWQEMAWPDRGALFRDAHRCMRQCLVDYARRRKRRAQVQVGAFDTENVASLAKLGALDLDRLVWDAAERAELAEALAAALEQLANDYPGRNLAAIVEFRVYEGLGQAEIARMLEVDERTVRNREKLAYALLRQGLQDFFQ
jgi:RNA polymerase sigma factor (sigma-70 family)